MGRKIKGPPIHLQMRYDPSMKFTRADLFKFLAQSLDRQFQVFLSPSDFNGGAGLRDWPARNNFTVGLKSAVWKARLAGHRPCDMLLHIVRFVPHHLRNKIVPDDIRQQFWAARAKLLRKQHADDKFYDPLEANEFVIRELVAKNPELLFTNIRYRQVTRIRGHVTMVCWYKDIPVDIDFEIPAKRDPFNGVKHI